MRVVANAFIPLHPKANNELHCQFARASLVQQQRPATGTQYAIHRGVAQNRHSLCDAAFFEVYQATEGISVP